MRSCSFSDAGVVATVRFGLMTGGELGIEAVWKRFMSPQAASDAAHNRSAGAAKTRRLIPVSRRPVSQFTSATLQISRRGAAALPALPEHDFPPKDNAHLYGS